MAAAAAEVMKLHVTVACLFKRIGLCQDISRIIWRMAGLSLPASVRVIGFGAISLLSHQLEADTTDNQMNTLSKLLKSSGIHYAPTLVLDTATNRVMKFEDVKNDPIRNGAQLELYGGAIDVVARGKRSTYGPLLKAAFPKKTRQAVYRSILGALLMILGVAAMWFGETHGASALATNIAATRLEIGFISSLHFSAQDLSCANSAFGSDQYDVGEVEFSGLQCNGAHVARIFDHVGDKRTTGAQLTCDSFEAKVVGLRGHLCEAPVGRNGSFLGFEVSKFQRMVEGRTLGTERVYIPSGDVTYITQYVILKVLEKAVQAWVLALVALRMMRMLQVGAGTFLVPMLLFGLGLWLALALPVGNRATYPLPRAAQLHSVHAFWTSNHLFTLSAMYFFAVVQLSWTRVLLE